MTNTDLTLGAGYDTMHRETLGESDYAIKRKGGTRLQEDKNGIRVIK